MPPCEQKISDERLRNTRSWAAARVGSLSGAEVIVAACDEALAARAAAPSPTAPRMTDIIAVDDQGKPVHLLSADRIFPIQTQSFDRSGKGQISETVYMAAYEVYSHVNGPQAAMIDLEGRNCRGGFGVGELVAFLYARSFPKKEWSDRVDQAFRNMKGLS